MAVFRNNPYGNSQFNVEINGIDNMAFDQVLLPELGVEVTEYREGTDPEHASRKLPGRSYFSNLLLRRGFNGSLALYEWWLDASSGDSGARRNLTIALLDEERNPVLRCAFRNAFPARYTFSPLDAQDGSPWVESVEVAFDSMTLE
jgi:phage tail-like protein